MESRVVALFLLFNLLFFTCVTAKCAPSTAPPASSPPATKKTAKCPKNTLKLGACADILGLVHLGAGGFSSSKCCTLLTGLTDLEAAVCLCTAIKANVLGISLNIPISLSLLVNTCGKKLPSGYTCA